MDKLVSVIVAIYNVSPFLRKCVDSIIGQTYKNIEIILIDDGSSDDSANIVKSYTSEDKRIVAIHKENGGLSEARNAGLEVATGDYITFIDGDDYIHKVFIEKLVEAIKRTDADIACCGYEFFLDEENYLEENTSKKIVINSEEAIVKMLRRDGIEHQAWGKLYKSRLFKEKTDNLIDLNDLYSEKQIYYPYINGIYRFPKGILNEDLALIYYVFSSCDRIVVTDQKLYYYRKNPDSIMRRKIRKEDLNVIDLLEILTEALNRIYHSSAVNEAVYDYKCAAYTKVYKRMVMKADHQFNEQEEIFQFLICDRRKILNSSVSLPTKIRALTASYSKTIFKLLSRVENLMGADS